MEPQETECRHKKTVKQILQSDGYLVIATKGDKVCISYTMSENLIAGIATAIKTSRDITTMIFEALLRVERGERYQ